MPSKLQSIYDDLGIDRKLTKRRYRRKKEFNHVKDNTRLQEDCNFMIDILDLPTAPFGFKYLLVCCDIATDEFDIEQMKNKDSETVLNAFKKMLTREYLNKPKYYMISDNGTEFLDVFQKYLYDESIYHKTALKNRHTQLANIDSLCAVLGRIFNGFMNEKEKLTGRISKNWTSIIPDVRKKLNILRKKKLPTNLKTDNSQPLVNTTVKNNTEELDEKNNKSSVKIESFVKPKFKVGQKVYVVLDTPKSILGKDQKNTRFREGDVTVSLKKHTILEILYMNGSGPTIRYIVTGYKNVSFSEDQLKSRL
jgi:hypothetical protein